MVILHISAPYQTNCSIHTDCEELCKALLLKHGKYIRVSDECADMTVSARKQGSTCEIRTAQEMLTTDYPLLEIDRILFENTRYDDAVFALHGAAVEWNGKAYLFLASTLCGKTTLASYLTGHGFGYITDDCILLDRTSFQIYPYHTPIHLREGGLEVLKRYNAMPENLYLLDDACIQRYIYTPVNCVTSPLPLGEIFFLKRTEQENRVIPMQTTERMTELLKAPITDYKITAEYLSFLSRLARAGCRRLLYSDMDYVAEVIRSG